MVVHDMIRLLFILWNKKGKKLLSIANSRIYKGERKTGDNNTMLGLSSEMVNCQE